VIRRHGCLASMSPSREERPADDLDPFAGDGLDAEALWGALDRHLAGEMTHEDMPVLGQWMAETPGAFEELEVLRTVVRAPIVYPPLAGADEVWGRLRARMSGRRASWGRWTGRWAPVVGALAAALVVWVVTLSRADRLARAGTAAVSVTGDSGVVVAETGGQRGPVAGVAAADSLVTGQATAGGHGGGVGVAAGALAAERPSRLVARGEANDGRERRDVARSPYAGTPLDVGARGAGPAAASSVVSVADEEPGAADSHWP
jgi:hypothetical protein